MRSALLAVLLLVPAGDVLAQSANFQRDAVPWSNASLESSGSASWTARLLSALGGAAIGAGVGFFASQVVQGDWDDDSGERPARPVWAAVGGSIGFAVGFSFPVPGGPPDAARPAEVPARSRIHASEIPVGAKTAWEVVRLLRPEWLNPRGVHVIGEGDDDGIQVYLDGVRLGGVRFLSDVPAQTILEMRLFSAADATLRWGAGNSHGAILIVVDGGEGTNRGPE